MSRPRFFVERLQGSRVRLTADEARHAILARRLSAGDRVSLFDAGGRQAEGVIAAVARDGVEVAIERIEEAGVAGPALVLAVAAPKGPRAEWMVEKAAELGVAAIWPMVTERSVVKPGDAKLEKWRRIAREANKQSGRGDIMSIDPLQPLAAVIGRFCEFAGVWIADVEGPTPERGEPFGPQWASETDRQNSTGLILIGPEGGWSDQERERIRAGGARPIWLGRHVLRVETAALAAAVRWLTWRADDSPLTGAM